MRSAVVLIHGYGFDSRIWLPIEHAFDGWRIIHLSLPGFGTTGPDLPYTIEELAAKFWAKLDEEGCSSVHLMGHSMGGYVCIEMCAQHPARVESLAMIHSHVFKDSPEKYASRTSVMLEIEAVGHEAFAKKMISSLVYRPESHPELVSMLVERGIAYSTQAWLLGMKAIRDRKDHSETLRQLQIPVLFVLGNDDAAIPVELGCSQGALAERCLLKVYPHTGHLAMYENSQSLIKDIQLFHGAFLN